jgi:hypothetical protein
MSSADPKSIATQRLDAIVRWSKLTCIVNLVGAVFVVSVLTFGLVEYLRFRAGVAAASAEFEKGLARMRKDFIPIQFSKQRQQ